MKKYIFLLLIVCLAIVGKCYSKKIIQAVKSRAGFLNNNPIYDTTFKLNIGHGVGKVYNNNVANSLHPIHYFDGNKKDGYWPGGEAYYPLKTIIDLEGTYSLRTIVVFDRNTNAKLTIRSGVSLFNMTEDAKLTLDESNARVIDLKNKKANFIEIEVKEGGGPAEIEVYGKSIAVSAAALPRVVRPFKKYKDLIGSNGNEHGPLSLYPWKGFMFREYDYTSLYLNKSDTLFKFNPNYEVPGGFMFMDEHYAAAKEAGIVTMPVIFTSPEKIYKASYVAAGKGDKWIPDYVPVQYGADKLNPGSYISIGRLAYQVGARYGRTKVEEKNLKIDLTPHWNMANEKKTALDLLQYVEFGNEPNRWWGPKEAQWQPFELAAYLSCVYDGHNGKLGPLVGIKQADPSMKFVMSALADYGLETIKLIYYWSKAHRKDGKFPADAINIHGYTTTGGNQYSGNTKGVAPEIFLQHGIKSSMNEITEWMHQNLPGVEIMWTEYGYDSNKKSIMGIPLLTKAQRLAAAFPLNSLQVQGAFIIRTQLEMMSVPYLDRMLQFQMWNENHLLEVAEPDQETNLNDKGYYDPYYGALQFSTSGLTQGWYSPKPFGRKPSWFMQHNTYHALSNCKFLEDRSKNGYRHYVFTDSVQKIVHAVWKPTQDGSQLNQQKIQIGSNQAKMVEMESEIYKLASLNVKDQSVVININEIPKIIICTTSENHSPEVNAQKSVKINAHDSTATITGAATDPEGSITYWKWTKIKGSDVKMKEAFTSNQSTLTLKGILPGRYVFTLSVKDDLEAVNQDEVILDVPEFKK